jgi:hypothetical protein
LVGLYCRYVWVYLGSGRALALAGRYGFFMGNEKIMPELYLIPSVKTETE